MNSRCPHCASVYEISEAALAAADGVVRCGNCMQLFDAAQNEVVEDPGTNQETLAEEIFSEIQEIDEELHAEQNISEAESTDSYQESTLEDAVQQTNAGESQPEPSADETSLIDSDNEEPIRFASLADSEYEPIALESDEPLDQASNEVFEESGDLNNEARDHSQSMEPAFPEAPSQSINEAEADNRFTSEPEMESLIAGDDKEQNSSMTEASPAATAKEDISGLDTNANSIKEQNTLTVDDSEDDLNFPGNGSTQPQETASGFSASLDDTFIANINSNSVEENKRSKLSRLVFALAASIIGLILAGQWLLAHVNLPVTKYAWLEQAKYLACQYAFCDISNKQDISRHYASIDLLVQSHPSEKQALILKTTLVNQSTRTLPYPRLAIQFSDLSNRVTAARTFSPEDYLNDSLLKLATNGLASNQPVEIELEFLDPGPQAVNYSLHFLPDQNNSPNG